MKEATEFRRAPLISKRPLRTSVFQIALSFVCLCLLVSIAACSVPAYISQIPPMIPISYYQCYETTPEELVGAYFAPYSKPWLAAMQYNNQVFMLKNIEVNTGMLETRETDHIWISKIICYAMIPGEISRLKAGQRLDIIGVNQGISKEWRSSIYMTGCYFLPAGSLALPAGIGPVFTAGY